MRENIVSVKPIMTRFYQADADYIAERIGELHSHAVLHDGELCAKLNRARIGGMIEVLNRMQLTVCCSWNDYDRNVLVMTDDEFVEHKARMAAASKVNAKGGK